MGLVTESVAVGDVGQRGVGREHDLTRRLDATTCDVNQRRYTKGIFESMREVTDTQAENSSQLICAY
jgi:hypothetical protein